MGITRRKALAAVQIGLGLAGILFVCLIGLGLFLEVLFLALRSVAR